MLSSSRGYLFEIHNHFLSQYDLHADTRAIDLRARARLGVVGLTVVFIFLLLSPLAQSASEVDYHIESTELTVYRDGLIHVTQLLVVNETLPAISVELLTPLAENVVVG